MHGFFLALATTIAEPSTILPLMVNHFSDSAILVGIFASLLRGGAILVQLVAAYYAQSYERVMPYMRIVFLFRFLSWFMIGMAIYIVGDENPSLTLWFIGIGLFIFSFSAGFGSVYFKEIMAKAFDKTQRGKTMANRQFFSSFGAIISGGIAGYILQNYEAPNSYAFIFMGSSFLMAIGLFAFSIIDEPVKKNISVKEDSFFKFIKNSFSLLKGDNRLQIQIIVSLLGYSFLFAMPFVILKAKEAFDLTGWLIGGFITIQMIGSMVGNAVLWKNKKFINDYRLMITLAYLFFIISFIVAFFANNPFLYGLVFFLFGMAIDGLMISNMNLIFEIAPEDKRPVYVALQSTFSSIGLFFSILGGAILSMFGYNVLYLFTIIMFLIGFYFVRRL
jgi:MFS family permease